MGQPVHLLHKRRDKVSIRSLFYLFVYFRSRAAAFLCEEKSSNCEQFHELVRNALLGFMQHIWIKIYKLLQCSSNYATFKILIKV